MTAYYNENDPKAAAWIQEMMNDGLIAPGDVDTRSIEDITPNELRNYTQCHFFAGIGVWSYALRKAGWPDGRPVWTGSCPCQPFSSAGKRGGIVDERHLWPAWYWLISECQKSWGDPFTIFGEQVASKDGLTWLDIVQTDLEAAGYAVGAKDFCSSGFGAPHIRQRLFFVADYERLGRRGRSDGNTTGCSGPLQVKGRGDVIGLADANNIKLSRIENPAEPTGFAGTSYDRGIGRLADAECGAGQLSPETGRHDRNEVAGNGSTGVMGNSDNAGSQGRCLRSIESTGECTPRTAGPVNGFWRGANWVYCRDGKWRPFEPTAFPLANGSPGRVGLLRGAGNAINAEQATEFIISCRQIL